MIKIGVLTNKTWAKQRPPLIVRPVSAALLAEISRMAIKPAANGSSSSGKPTVGPAALRGSRGKQAAKKPAGPVKSLPETRSQPVRSEPQNGGRPNSQSSSPRANASGSSSVPRPQNGKPAGNALVPGNRPGGTNGTAGQNTGLQRPTSPHPTNNRSGFNQQRPNQAGSNYRPNGTPANPDTGKNSFNRPNSTDRNPAGNRYNGQPSNGGKWGSGSAKPDDARNGTSKQDPAANGSISNEKPAQGPATNRSNANGKPTVGPASNGPSSNGRPAQGPASNGPSSNGKPASGPVSKGPESKDLTGQGRVERSSSLDWPVRRPPETRSQDTNQPNSGFPAPTARPKSEPDKEPPKGLIKDQEPEEPSAQHVLPSLPATPAREGPEFEDLAADETAEEQEEVEVQDTFDKDKKDTAAASSAGTPFEPTNREDDAGKPDSSARYGQDKAVPSTDSNSPDTKPENGKPRTPGNIGRSSLFRPDVFASMSTFRVPSKMEPPKAEPPRPKPWNEPPHSDSTRVDRPVQIPMEVHLPSQNGQNGSSHNGNGKSTPSYPSAQPAAPRSSQDQGNQPGDLRKAIQRMLEQQNDLPEQIAILGAGEDGLPVLFDLQDPTPGAVVAISDERQAELELLRTAVASLASRNSPRSVQFLVFSVEPAKWRAWVTEQGFDRHCLAVVGAEDESIREWTLRLADWTEQRRLGQRGGPPVLLVMDTLNFLTRLAYDVRLNFEWMAKEGPQAQIWPLAAISSDLAKSLNQRRLLRAFPMRIFGCFQEPADYAQLANLNEEETADFGRSGEFAVRLGEHWLRFHLLNRK